MVDSKDQTLNEQPDWAAKLLDSIVDYAWTCGHCDSPCERSLVKGTLDQIKSAVRAELRSGVVS
jgi:hypothetical protein